MMQIVIPNKIHLRAIADKHNQNYEFIEMLYMHAQSNQNYEEYFESHNVSEELKEDILFAVNELTVGGLIKILSEFPKDMVVVSDGYEGGMESVVGAEIIDIEFDKNKEWYYGKHEQCVSSKDKGLYIKTTRGWRR